MKCSLTNGHPGSGQAANVSLEPTFTDRTVTLFLWMSRHYVAGKLTGDQRLTVNRHSLWTPTERLLLSVLSRLWDRVIAATPTGLSVRSPTCDRVSPQEQAILIALGHLGNSEIGEYRNTLRTILPPAAASALHGDMLDLTHIAQMLDREFAEGIKKDNLSPVRPCAELSIE